MTGISLFVVGSTLVSIYLPGWTVVPLRMAGVRSFGSIFRLEISEPTGQSIADVQQSHIDANVPSPEHFERILQRDLGAYFAKNRRRKRVRVDFELLRKGPTQSGVSYPKFHAWVRIDAGRSSADRGAVRVAAIDRKRFEVTSFVSEQEIRAAPDALYRVFPTAVCETIKERAGP